jgi:hypothetical protein
MCNLCGQVQPDLVSVAGLTVCASRRHCLLYALRHASDFTVARLHSIALQDALRSTESMELVAS